MYSTIGLIDDYKENKPEDFADDNFHHAIKMINISQVYNKFVVIST